MKNYIIATLIVFVTLSMHAQDQFSKSINLAKGDVIEVGNPSSKMYKHIKLPRGNFVGTEKGVSNYKSALGNEVVVTNIKKMQNGNTIISVKRNDGKLFFNTVATLNISLEKALRVNEIKLM
ncbi:hypothetical protein EV196_104203 [Mariniflexile fucanivorans]|uniref:Uncharacterized protein n=1 Tax=Mariniflexile fucanivorans TaxID=264023 RepID=A0A4R1RJ69_9FLAO|nr:hypothetical protein [Mariniflexile fucanivorans]TCL66173.1 hypothetical protein EV196_104203 [Mariniflexile fucanivorans]